MAESLEIAITADTEPFRAALGDLQRLSRGFGAELTDALKSAAVSGKDLDGVLRQIGLNLAGMALSQGLAPLKGLLGSALSGLFGGATGFAKGGVVPFAGGGVVAEPTYFPTGGGLGLMGEAGPEAILPLRRAADGRLGVAAGGGGQKLSVVFNVTAQDVRSFAKSEAQITGMLARAVTRGARTI